MKVGSRVKAIRLPDGCEREGTVIAIMVDDVAMVRVRFDGIYFVNRAHSGPLGGVPECSQFTQWHMEEEVHENLP